MTSDQLRALADALDPSGKVLTHPGNSALQRAADYLRAQADAQPVAWQFKIRVWIGEDLFEERDHVSREWREGAAPLYLHTAPAAPQASEDANVWKQIIPDDVPQAEPKREPNPDEVICPACTHQFRAIPENVQAQLWAKCEPLSDEQIIEIQRAAYERAAQECIETAAELRRCADGCTDGRYDWKADGVDDCADAIRALGGEK